jgi:hypothetical protein
MEFNKIFSKKNAQIFEEINSSKTEILGIEDFVTRADLAIEICTRKAILGISGRQILSRFRHIETLALELADITKKPVRNLEILALWHKVMKLLAICPNPEEIFKELLDDLACPAQAILTSGQNFHELTATLYKLTNEMPDSQECAKSLVTLESMYYDTMVSKLDGVESEDAKVLFSTIFKRVEENDSFYLQTSKMINWLMTQIDAGAIWKVYSLDKKIDDFMGAPSINWLNSELQKNPKRLPYLIIMWMKSDAFSKNVENELNNVPESGIMRAFYDFEKASVKEHLNFQDLLAIATVELAIEMYAKMPQNTPNLRLKSFISGMCSRSNSWCASLQVYTLKALKKHRGIPRWNKELFKRVLSDSWVDDYFKVDILAEFAELAPVSDIEGYQKCTSLISESLGNPEKAAQELIQWLGQAPSVTALHSFYCAIVNEFIGYRFSNAHTAKQLSKEFVKNSAKLTQILGHVGYRFIMGVIDGFPETSPLFVPENPTANKHRAAISSMGCFAMLLSLKNSQLGFAGLLWNDSQFVTEIATHLTKIYLPGMIMPNSEKISLMLSVDYSTPTSIAWKCSQNCDYYYAFANCGQVNRQVVNGRPIDIYCPLCRRQIGTRNHADHLQPIEGQISMTKDEARAQITYHLAKFKNSYDIGPYNFSILASQMNRFELNVPAACTNVLNFISNCLFAGLVSCRILSPQQADKILQIQNSDLFLSTKIDSNIQMAARDFPRSNPTVLLNQAIRSIMMTPSKKDYFKNLEDYFYMERSAWADHLRNIFGTPINAENDYKTVLLSLSTQQQNRSTSIAILEEVDRYCFKIYPGLSHLRLSHTQFTFQEFAQEFESLSCVAGRAHPYPFTQKFMGDFGQLSKLKLVLQFKQFFEEFEQKFGGKLSRKIAEHTSIDLFMRNHPKLDKMCRNFVNSWNQAIAQNDQIMYECEPIKLEKIDVKGPLAAILPVTSKQIRGSNVIFGLRYMLRAQNQLLDNLLPEADTFASYRCSWSHINDQTIFSMNINELENVINGRCVNAYCDYGYLGAAKINFEAFEQYLENRVRNLRRFLEGDGLIPAFNYSFEAGDLNELLIKFGESCPQRALEPHQRVRLLARLESISQLTNQNDYAILYLFMWRVLIPRCTLASRGRGRMTVAEAMEGESEIWPQDLPLAEDIRQLCVTYLTSFLLLIENEIYKIFFVGTSIHQSWFQLDPTWPDWVGLLPAVTVLKNQIHKLPENDKNELFKALARMVFRAAFDTEISLGSVYERITNQTLWEPDYDFEFIGELTNFTDVRMDMSYLLLCFLEYSEPKVQKPTPAISLAGLIRQGDEYEPDAPKPTVLRRRRI